MKTRLECYPCFLRQAIEAARLAGGDDEQQFLVLRSVIDELRAFDRESTPPEMAHRIHEIIRAAVGSADPYRQVKEESTARALALRDRLKARIAASTDPIETAVRLAIAGNIIDFGYAADFDLEGTIERVLSDPFAVDGRVPFRAALERLGPKDRILYLADNAGETVFDRLLIETLERPVTYVVKSGPILNDATREDAAAAGLEAAAEIVENGSNAPGTILPLCSAAFRELFDAAPMIIAKGQANYECLSGVDAPLFFLLQAKCPVIARHLAVPEKGIVLQA